MIALADLKDHLRLDKADTSEDGYLASLEKAAVAASERWTGRYFGADAARTEYLTGHGGRDLWLADTPTTVTTVEVDGQAIPAADYSIRPNRLRHVSGWRIGADIRAVYKAGYATGAEPADVRQAVTLLVAHWYEIRTPVVVGTITAEVPMGVREMLAPWRRVRA